MTTASLATGMLLVAFLPGISAAAPLAVGHPSVAPATSPTDQWAFGGSDSVSYSCTESTPCPGSTNTTDQVVSLSYSIQVHWAVIYAQTNVSDSQTELWAKAALGVSASFSLSECVTTSPCVSETLSASISGWETAAGYTNVTTSEMDLSGGPGAPGPVDAFAIMNAASQEAFNFTGNLNLNEQGSTPETAAISFDFGGHESSTVNFPAPLDVLPVDPSPGDNWSSSAEFTASGSYVAGGSLSGSEDGTSYSYSSWVPGGVTTSGWVNVTGNDTGTSEITDNYVSPPKTFTVQDIELNISGGNYSATDGWLLVSAAAYDNLFTGLEAEVAPAAHGLGPAVSAADGYSSPEGVYYLDGRGILDGSLSGSLSTVDSSVPDGPTVAFSGGPEPVSVAQSQYNAITSPATSAPFPLLLVVGVVVVVVVVVACAALVMRNRSARRPPAADTPLVPAAATDTPLTPAGMQPPPSGGQP